MAVKKQRVHEVGVPEMSVSVYARSRGVPRSDSIPLVVKQLVSGRIFAARKALSAIIQKSSWNFMGFTLSQPITPLRDIPVGLSYLRAYMAWFLDEAAL